MMNTYPLVSCSLMTYKRFENTFRSIDSVFEQNYPNIELIVADDGSGNFPKEDIEAYIEKNRTPNIKNVIVFTNEKNLGTVRHFTNTIKNVMNGEYFIHLETDDVYYNADTVGDIVDCFIKNDAALVAARRDCIDYHTSESLFLLPTEQECELLRQGDSLKIYKRLSYANFLSGACTYYSKGVMERLDYFDMDYFLLEDYPFYLRAARLGEKIALLDKPTIVYKVGEGVSTKGNESPTFKKLMIDMDLTLQKEVVEPAKTMPKTIRRMGEFLGEHAEIKKKRGGSITAADKIKLALKYPVQTFELLSINADRRRTMKDRTI